MIDFYDLEVSNLRDTFYNKHNIVLKKRDISGNLVGQDLKQWEFKMNEYINKTGVFLAITSLHSDQGYIFTLCECFYSVFSI